MSEQENGFRLWEPKPTRMKHRLEHQLECYLDVTRIVTSSLDFANAAPVGVVGDVPRAAVDRVVEDIQEVAAELCVHALHLELLAHAQIEVSCGRFTQCAEVLRLVPVGVREWLAAGILSAGCESAVALRREALEGVGVDPVMLVAVSRLCIAHQIRHAASGEPIVAQRIGAELHGNPERIATGQANRAGEVPSADGLADDLRSRATPAAAAAVG